MIIHVADALTPPNLHGPVLIDAHGLPRYWACVWFTALAGGLADSTHLKKLRYIGNLYQHADELYGRHALDDALGALNDRTLADILESWFISIRNQLDTSEGDEKRWQTGFGFVTSIVTLLAKNDANTFYVVKRIST